MKTAMRITAFIICIVMVLGMVLPYIIASAAEEEPLKKRATYFTEEKIANARENITKYTWASTEKSNYLSVANLYLKKGYDFIWYSLASQSLPRSYAVNQDAGCLNCGKKIDEFGNYPYKHDPLTDPWKITCPSCGMKFPTNDFEAFYNSALDDNGNFVLEKGDKSLLKNTLYPDKGENWGVDNGWGYKHTDGKKYTFVAHYNHEVNFRIEFIRAIDALYYSYLYTGEQKYADAAIVYLDRIASIYPDMDTSNQTVANGFLHSDGGSGKGKILGSIWETGLVDHYIYAYDALFTAYPNMSSEAKDFLKKVSGGERDTYKKLMIHVENGILKQVFPAFKKGQIRGNMGMHQQTLALAAVVLDDKTLSKQWLDHDFKMGNDNSVGGNILGVFVNLVDRDGYGYEAAPGYNSGWLSDFLGIAELLKGYRIGGDGESFDLYENVKFKKMIYSFIDLTVSNKFTPSIGDSGKTGYSGLSVNIDNLIKGYLQYGDPYLAQAIYLVNKETTEGLKTGIFDKDPESLGEKIEAVIKEKGTIKVDSVNLTGYGYACVKGFSDNDPGGEAVSYPKSAVYDFASLEVLNGTVMTGVVKNDGYVSFTPDEEHNAASFCFYLDNIRSVYEITFKAVGTGNDSKAAVYIDGKCIQDSVSFKENEGKEFTVFIKRTLELSKGFHMVTFDSLTGDEIRLVSMSVRRSANSSSEGSIVDHNKETAVYMYYGKSTAHGHFDNLNLALYSYDVDMMPDLGYPEFTDAYDMHRRYLVDHTISHNTVMVDNRAQGEVNVAIPVLYDSSDLVKLISVESPKAYPGLKDYRRTTAAIKCGDGEYYLADFFTVKGGSNHKYILHGAESSSVDTAGITLKAQEGGTLLNEKGEYGKPNDASGMQWFRNVKRGEDPENGFTVDWSVVDTWGYATAKNIHLKVTLLGDYDKAALADATPPANKPGNPEALTYLFVEREGKDLASMFNSVIEPYAGESKISSVCEVPVYEKGGKTDVTSEYLKACKVELVNGRVDYIVYNGGDTNKTYSVADVFDFTGSFAVYTVNGENTVIYTNDAYVNGREDNVRGITGKVTDFTKELTDKNYITVSLNKDIAPEKLAGQYVYIDKYFEASYNGCFEIVSAEKLSDGKYSLYIGDVTLAEAFASSSDVNGGYKYSIAVNADLYIPFAYTAGDADSLFKVKAEKVFSTLTLSHSMKKDSAKGDYVGTIFPVYENVRASKDMTPYSLEIVSDFKDGKLFELREGNKLYLALDPGERALGTEFAVRFEITAEGGAAESFDIGIPMLTKNASDKLVYPSFSLERTAPSSEDEVSEDEGDEQGNPAEPSGSITWIIIIAAVLAVIAGAAVFVIIKKKGNKG